MKYFPEFIQKVNQVIYWSLPICFKALAPIVFDIFYWQDKNTPIYKGP